MNAGITRWQSIKKKTKERTKKVVSIFLKQKQIVSLHVYTKNLARFVLSSIRLIHRHSKLLEADVSNTGNESENFRSSLCNFVGKEGEFAFCLTDIVGSTKYWNDMEEIMKLKVRKHARIGFRLVKELNGYVSKVEGDSFFVVFENLNNAVEFGNRMIVEHSHCELEPKVDLRVGVTYGKARVGDYFQHMFTGEAVTKVYRLNDIARPNTILMDEQVCEDYENKCIY